MNPDLKLTIWNVLFGVLAALIIFFILTRTARETKNQKKPKPHFKFILISVFCVIFVGAGFYSLFLFNSDNARTVKFPTTGGNLNQIDWSITASILITIILLATATFKNISLRKRIEKDLRDAKIAAQNVYEDLQMEAEALAEAKAKEEAILLSIGDGLIATDEKGKIVLINQIAEGMLDQKNEEVIGQVFYEAILMEDEKGVSVPLEKHPIKIALSISTTTTTTTTTTGPTYYFVSKNKTKFPIAITVTPVMLMGKVIGTIEVFRDITREKEIDKAKGEFVSLASHQLRTPLTTVSWYTEMILNGDVGPVPQGQKKYLQAIYQGNNRMIELVNTLLDVSRIELGTFKIEPIETDIIALAQNVLLELNPRIEKKKISMTKRFGKDVPLFLSDPKLLRMVVQNILTNAIEYTPEDGKIDFAITVENFKTILMKVTDTGCGIPKNQQDKIFTKLFRADNVRAKDTDGTGLGLYIVKSIVENAGGKIWFESEENKGTTFYVSFPYKKLLKI